MADLPPPALLLDRPPRPADVPTGWTARPGFDLPATPWDLAGQRWACLGTVADDDGAAAAVTALARGVGVVAEVRLDGRRRVRFQEDVVRLASVDEPGSPVLGDEQAALLAALAGGATVTSAARDLHVSRRTASRLLAEARDRLGAATTAEAVSRWEARPRP